MLEVGARDYSSSQEVPGLGAADRIFTGVKAQLSYFIEIIYYALEKINNRVPPKPDSIK
jgi:hypothetical protein